MPVYKNPRTAVLLAMAVATAVPSMVAAADASNDASPTDGAPLTTLNPVVVTAQRLDAERAGIETQTGASTYTIDSAEIDAEPGGQNVQLNQVLLQAPDVVQDSFGQLHVRGDHNDLQYRLNGIILPEGISVFSQTLDPRLIASLNLITGALPAEYGLATAGIIDLTTQSGLLQAGRLRISVYGGSHSTFEPAAEVRRQRRQFQLLRHRRHAAQRPRHRVARWQLRAAARSLHTGPRLRLFRGHPRLRRPPVAHARRLGRCSSRFRTSTVCEPSRSSLARLQRNQPDYSSATTSMRLSTSSRSTPS